MTCMKAMPKANEPISRTSWKRPSVLLPAEASVDVCGQLASWKSSRAVLLQKPSESWLTNAGSFSSLSAVSVRKEETTWSWLNMKQITKCTRNVERRPAIWHWHGEGPGFFGT
eukprot:CAMPEP_0181464458 /NCGR_PEP_ID=MMETSP1110-20121109/35444_1 /TAXON_ID=174948 /ORGANISM="Symbiodinium sp., Strain CCMP421" /LENGTH=112 /DNA_ID=CAMNT_0023589195 /DNA_START=301 /DNA_END=639 /DNA_ORIENTATION=-